MKNEMKKPQKPRRLKIKYCNLILKKKRITNVIAMTSWVIATVKVIWADVRKGPLLHLNGFKKFMSTISNSVAVVL